MTVNNLSDLVRKSDGLCIEQELSSNQFQLQWVLLGRSLASVMVEITVETALGFWVGRDFCLANGFNFRHRLLLSVALMSTMTLAHQQRKKSSFFHLRIRQLQIPKEILKPLTHSLWPGRCCRARQWWPLYSDNLMSRHGIRRLDWGKWPRCDRCGNCDHHWNFVVQIV